jgi:hypothetical protein
MPFTAVELKSAFEDGRRAERKRILDVLRDKIKPNHNGDAMNEYNYYVKLFNAADHWDIGEI